MEDFIKDLFGNDDEGKKGSLEKTVDSLDSALDSVQQVLDVSEGIAKKYQIISSLFIQCIDITFDEKSTDNQ